MTYKYAYDNSTETSEDEVVEHENARDDQTLIVTCVTKKWSEIII